MKYHWICASQSGQSLFFVAHRKSVQSHRLIGVTLECPRMGRKFFVTRIPTRFDSDNAA